MIRLLRSPAAAIAIMATLATGPAGASADELQAKQLQSSIPVTMNYWLSVPDQADADAKLPLMLFLHGAGERGDDLDLVKKHGPPKLIGQGKSFPMIVVAPQCPADQVWQPVELKALIDEVASQHPVDLERVYVTGLSMGGFGTWNLTALIPDRIAAAAPICGGGDKIAAKRIAGVPIWAFHGAKDSVVPLVRSEEMVAAVRAQGGEIELTVYPEARHDSWTETYENEELYAWMLAHRKPQ